MKTLVLGLGNPILCDDGIGIHTVKILKRILPSNQTTVLESNLSGLELIELLAGYDKAIIIDAIQTKDGMVGDVYRLESAFFDNLRHFSSPHDMNFSTALAFAKQMSINIPEEIILFAIEVEDVITFSEFCTKKVMDTIPTVVSLVKKELGIRESIEDT